MGIIFPRFQTKELQFLIPYPEDAFLPAGNSGTGIIQYHAVIPRFRDIQVKANFIRGIYHIDGTIIMLPVPEITRGSNRFVLSLPGITGLYNRDLYFRKLTADGLAVVKSKVRLYTGIIHFQYGIAAIRQSSRKPDQDISLCCFPG